MPENLQYVVELIKRGDGAKIAAADFDQLNTSAARATGTLQNNTRAGAQANQGLALTGGQAGKAARAFGILSGSMGSMAGSTFPQFSAGLMSLQAGMQNTSALAQVMGKNFGKLGGVLLGVQAASTGLNYFQEKWAKEARDRVSTIEQEIQVWEALNSTKSRAEQIEAAYQMRVNLIRELRGGAGVFDDWTEVAREYSQKAETARMVGMAQSDAAAAAKFGQMLGNPPAGVAAAQYGAQGLMPWQVQVEENRRAVFAMRDDVDKYYKGILELNLADVDQTKALNKERAASWAYFTGQARKENNVLFRDLQLIGQQSMELFSSGLAGAIVGAFEEGGQAFKKFAKQFMQQMAQMILQALILRAVQSIFGAASGGGQPGASSVSFTGGPGGALANGGQVPRMAAIGGTFEASRPTYFPGFNVVAGEAGREVMTVLARPRFMEVGGIAAQVGDANGERLAITKAADLSRAGGGGRIIVEVQSNPDTLVRVRNEAVDMAEVRVTQRMGEDSRLSRATKSLARPV